MKNSLLICLTLFLPFLISAQENSFKGDIKYDITYEGEGSEFMGSFSFTNFHYYFGSNVVRLKLTGGFSFLLGDFIVNSITEQTVMVNDIDEIAYIVEDVEEAEQESKAVVSVVETKKKEKILGYKCTKYVVTTTTDTSETVAEYWMTSKIKIGSDIDIDFADGLSVEGVQGFPLRVITKVDEITITQEAVLINDEPVEESFFQVPTNYAIKPFSECPLMQMTNGED